MIPNSAKRRGLLPVLVSLLVLGLPGTTLAGNNNSPARTAPAPEALKLPDSAFPSGTPLISHTVDAAYADAPAATGAGPNAFQPGSVYHSTTYASAGMVGGYYQVDVFNNPAGFKEASFWLASIYSTDAQAAARVDDAKASLRKGHVVEATPCPRVSGQNCSLFSFVGVSDPAHAWLIVATTANGGSALALYAVWSLGNVVAELALYGIPAGAVQPGSSGFARHFADLVIAADTTMNAAAGPTPTETATVTPTASPTPTQAPTSTATPTVTPTATSTATPTATTVVPRLKISVRGSLRAHHTGSMQVTVSSGPLIPRVNAHDANASARVTGARVTVDGRKVGMKQVLHGKTNQRGIATFKNLHPLKAGTVKVSATKAGFVSATIKVSVRP